jgi:hypothetical protein
MKTQPGRQKSATRRRARFRGARRSGPRESLLREDVAALRAELQRSVPPARATRWNPDPEDVQRSVAKLVLTLMEFLRKLLERQAVRRMEGHTLTEAEIEAVGLALMRLETTLRTMGDRFGLSPEDLNLDLGPLGRLI